MRRLTIILAAAIIFSCTDRTTSDGIRVIDADLTGKEVIELNLADLKKTALEYSDESIIVYTEIQQREYRQTDVFRQRRTVHLRHQPSRPRAR